MKLKFNYKNRKVTLAEILDLSDDPGMTKNVLYWRLVKTGMTVEDALKQPVNNSRRKFNWYGEEKYLYEIAADKRCQVSENCLRQRLLKGWNIQQAGLTPPRNYTRRTPTAPRIITPVKIEKTPRQEEREQRERLKKIMSKPINPEKDRYTEISTRVMKEANKQIRGKQ